jgi:glutamine amidotransferase
MTIDTAPVIRIVDYGQGNLGSIRNMLSRIGARSEVSSDPDEIGRATHLILPGVGAFDRGMKAIADRGLREVLDQQALEVRIPVLGICLGGFRPKRSALSSSLHYRSCRHQI